MISNSTALVGDIKHSTTDEDAEKFLESLEELMTRHKVDKIDVGWGRSALLKDFNDAI